MYLGAWQMTIQIPLWLKRGLGLSRKKWWLRYKNTGTYNSIQLHSKISSFDNFVACIYFNLTAKWKIKIMADSFYRIVQRLFGKFIRYSFKLLIYLLLSHLISLIRRMNLLEWNLWWLHLWKKFVCVSHFTVILKWPLCMNFKQFVLILMLYVNCFSTWIIWNLLQLYNIRNLHAMLKRCSPN